MKTDLLQTYFSMSISANVQDFSKPFVLKCLHLVSALLVDLIFNSHKITAKSHLTPELDSKVITKGKNYTQSKNYL